MEKILVIGATGPSGYCTVHELLKRGHKVIILYRSKKPEIESDKIDFIQGDASKKEDLQKALINATGVINCIGFGKGSGKETYFFSKINEMLVECMKESSASHLITMSNIGVFGSGNRFVYGFLVPLIMKWLKHIIDDKERLENSLKEEKIIKWANARYPNIIDGEEKEIRSNLNGKGLSLSITTASVGKSLVDLIEDKEKRGISLCFSN